MKTEIDITELTSLQKKKAVLYDFSIERPWIKRKERKL